MKAITGSLPLTICVCAVVLVFALMPFHAPLTVFLGSTFGGYDAWRLWKELLLLAVAPPAAFLLYKNRGLFARFRADTLIWLMLVYAGFTVISGLIALWIGEVSLRALGMGLVVDLRFIGFFLLCWVAAAHLPWLRAHWRQLLLAPAAAVISFGLLQLTVLPFDTLKHIGYGPETIPAYQTVDQKAEYIRLQSTLRGSNPLGAYLVLVLTALLALVFMQPAARLRAWLIAGLAGGFLVLGATYSRSAYIGAALAVGLLCWLLCRSTAARRRLLIAGVALVVLGTGVFAIYRNNDRFENVVFHTDEHSTSATSSNDARLGALSGGVRDVLTEPLGRGPGTAGPASVHNEESGPRIAENYYIQVGQETGWAGLGLLIAITVITAQRLFRRRKNTLFVVLFVSFLSLITINFVSHAWADDTLSLIWWGLAGLALAPPAIAAKNAQSAPKKNIV